MEFKKYDALIEAGNQAAEETKKLHDYLERTSTTNRILSREDVSRLLKEHTQSYRGSFHLIESCCNVPYKHCSNDKYKGDLFAFIGVLEREILRKLAEKK